MTLLYTEDELWAWAWVRILLLFCLISSAELLLPLPPAQEKYSISENKFVQVSSVQFQHNTGEGAKGPAQGGGVPQETQLTHHLCSSPLSGLWFWK